VTNSSEPPALHGLAQSAAQPAVSRAAAFDALAERNLDAAYRLARAIVHDDATAEDLTHDAFVTAWRRWDQLRDESRFEPWFTRILVNTCRDHLRRAAAAPVRDISPELASAGNDMDAAVSREAVRAALATLSPDHQVVIALRFYRDLTVDDIASLVGIPPNTVRSRIHYATKRLATLLGRDGGDR